MECLHVLILYHTRYSKIGLCVRFVMSLIIFYGSSLSGQNLLGSKVLPMHGSGWCVATQLPLPCKVAKPQMGMAG